MKKKLLLVGIILTIIFSGCVKPKVTCEIVNPKPNATIELGDVIELAVIAETENASLYEVQIYLDGVGYEKKHVFPFNFSIPTSNLEKGTHTIRAVAIASEEAKAESSVTFNLIQSESPDFVSFSNGKFPSGWNNEGWSITSPGYNDTHAIVSSYYYYSTVSATKTCNANIDYIEFYAKSYSYYGRLLYFYIDDANVAIELTDSWQRYSYPVTQGEHLFRWVSFEDNIAYLDDIKFYKE